MKNKNTYRTISALCSAFALLTQLGYAGPSAKAASVLPTPTTAGLYAATAEECGYWYFEAGGAENGKKLTNTFHTCGKTLEVYVNVRLALGAFEGELGAHGPFATREEADADKAAWREANPGAGTQEISVADPLE